MAANESKREGTVSWTPAGGSGGRNVGAEPSGVPLAVLKLF